MKTSLVTIAAAAVVLFSSSARAQDVSRVYTVQRLFDACRATSDSIKQLECLNYVSGVTDAITSIRNALISTPLCFDFGVGITHRQVEQQFMNWAERNLKYGQESAALGVEAALADAWPCHEGH
jgi:hypothetical protein